MPQGFGLSADLPRPGGQLGGLACRRDGLLMPTRLAERKGGTPQGYGRSADLPRPRGQLGGLARRRDGLLVPTRLAENPGTTAERQCSQGFGQFGREGRSGRRPAANRAGPVAAQMEQENTPFDVQQKLCRRIHICRDLLGQPLVCFRHQLEAH